VRKLVANQLKRDPTDLEFAGFLEQVTMVDGKTTLESYLDALLGAGWKAPGAGGKKTRRKSCVETILEGGASSAPESSPPLMLQWCNANVQTLQGRRKDKCPELVELATKMQEMSGEAGFCASWEEMFVEMDEAPFDMFFAMLQDSVLATSEEFAGYMARYEEECKAGWFHLSVSLAKGGEVDFNAADGPPLTKGEYDWVIFMKIIVALTCMEMLAGAETA